MIETFGGVSVVTPKPLKLPCGLWLMSDLHVGASNTDHERIRRDVKAAVKRGDRVLVNGDVFDAIISGDPRFTPTVLHPRLSDTDYPIDAAQDWAAELLQPAVDAGLLDYIGHGNHETAANKRSGGNLLEGLKLRWGTTGKKVQVGGYCGFVNYRLNVKGNPAARYTIFAHHGSKNGQGGTQLKRLAGIADADLVWLGHFHQRTTGGAYTIGLDDAGRLQVRERRQVMTGGYTFAWGQSPDGKPLDRYASVSALPPGLLGGVRVALNWADGLSVEVQS